MKKLIITIPLLFLNVNNASSHPHLFIDYATTFVYDNQQLAGIQMVWVFDEMFSSTMLLDYDTNKNKKLEPAEIKKLKYDAFSNLKQYNYFCKLSINKKPVRIKTVHSFSASVINGKKLVYSFFIPIGPKAGQGKDIKLLVRDQTNFCSFSILKHDGYAVKGLPSGSYDLSIKTININDTTWGPIASKQIVLRII